MEKIKKNCELKILKTPGLVNKEVDEMFQVTEHRFPCNL